MIKINMCYLDRFKKTYHDYIYPVSKGVYLCFDKNTLEYKGLHAFFNSAYYPVTKGEKVLERLICLGYIEIYTD